jgi:hypothetical protein
VGQDSSVGVANLYGLDDPEIESHRGHCFHTSPDRPSGSPSFLYNGYRVFPVGKASGRGVDHSPPSSAEVKERVELYIHSPFGPSWPVLG